MGEKYSWKKLKYLPPMRRLFDRWVPEALTMMGAIKFLQFLRLLGVKASVNGWRKVTSIFLRGESSKFVLGCFRLKPDAGALFAAPGKEIAASRLAAKLAAYLRVSDDIDYWVEPGRFAFVRRRRRFRDLLYVEVDKFGMIVKLKPYWDGFSRELENASPILEETLEFIKYQCNKMHNLPEQVRAVALLKAMKTWARRQSGFYYFGRRRRMYLVHRILNATVLFCEFMPSADRKNLLRERFQIPDFGKYRIPGLGMLGVMARFTGDLKEVDLWCQFNHVATDGLPMQEFLNKLKSDWGCAGSVVFPAMQENILSNMQLRYAGEGNFRTLLFIDFEPLLAVRRYLNEHYQQAMGGKAAVAGLIMWGLSRHDVFAKQKILLPVDAGVHNEDRILNLMMIRPRQFASEGSCSPLDDYCRFQKEMNLRLEQARTGRGAVSEFLELCAMMHPFFYHLARKIWPRALDEVLGTAGLSILRDAEIFIAPKTEFQSCGFIAVGNLKIPTADNRTAAAVSIAGSRKQIRYCLEAMRSLPGDLVGMLELQDKLPYLYAQCQSLTEKLK